jgi:hypothetical protein
MATVRWAWQEPGLLERLRHASPVDPPADGTVETIYREADPESVSKLLGTLVLNDQTPEGFHPAVKQYLDATAALPPWADAALLKRAERVFVEHGLTIYGMLGCVSLPESYAILDATRVLGRTMQLEDRTLVPRRIMETSLFVLDVMSPGGLAGGGRGIRTAQKVRLMHAAMRHLLLRTAPMARLRPPAEAAAPAGQALARALNDYLWKEREWGMPIHQVAMAAAIISFSFIVLRGLRAFGVRLSDAEERAYLHCWNVVGHVMGVREEVLLGRPETLEEAAAQYEAIWRAHQEASDDGRQLAGALLRYLEDCIDVHWTRRFPRILTYQLLGRQTAGLLGIGLDRTDAWLRPLVVTGMRVINQLPSGWLAWLDRAKVALFRDLFEDQLTRARGGNRPRYDLHPTLREAWRAKGLEI